ncbi:DNA polymerase [Thermomicrobium sp. 4228-Ro]|uniref:DNA polymerase n=1 Tax=Thermomicrobium sp. 4228-Ro TaxID=2993937 RepID=UPI0022498C0E|nr:DNA polymerase [Thermomicrobium sp. 4228-Ro]MCX2726024.1 DNA polymerase [Thermomicrobium sp. 4228-Ro]
MWSYALVRDVPDLPPGPVALDIETTGLRTGVDEVVVITVATPDQAWVIDCRALNRESVAEWLRRLFARHAILVHNAIFDVVFLQVAYGIPAPRVGSLWDTKLVEGILRGGAADASLQELAQDYLGLALDKSWQTSFADGGDLSEEQVRYAAYDALVLHGIQAAQHRRLRDREHLFRVVALEHRVAPAFWEMQRRGVAVDLAVLEEAAESWRSESEALRVRLEGRLTRRVIAMRESRVARSEEDLRRWNEELEAVLAECEAEWREHREDPSWQAVLRETWLGYPVTERTTVTEEEIQRWLDPEKGLRRYLDRVRQRFRREHPRPSVPRVDVWAPINLLSSQQLLEALNGELREAGLAEVSTTESKVLRSLLGASEDLDREVLRPLLRYRELEKLLDFVEQIREHTRGGVLYPDWQQIGAATGRASCRNPNLMAQPKFAGFRRAFVAREGHVLVTADYSQIELRIMAALSGDPEMTRAFVEGQDLHRLTASRIFGVPEDTVTERQRKIGKQVNFGTLYGMGARRLVAELAAQGIRISVEEAQEALDGWRRTYRRAAGWIRERGEEAVREGSVETALGRIRSFPPPRDAAEAASIARRGGNLPIQGTAADIMKLAMSELVGMGIVLQVHDELVLEVPEQQAEVAAAVIGETMRRCAEEVLDGFPVEVDVTVGRSWAEAAE